MGFNSGPTDFMFTFVPVMFVIIFILVFLVVIFNIVKGVSKWNYNNSQPVLSVPAKVISKRTKVSSSFHDSDNAGHHHRTYTDYYITFEVESGDRMEFEIKDSEYGMLVEGDKGKLTFQGTRYLEFKREL